MRLTAEEREELAEAAYKGVTSHGYNIVRAEKALTRVVERFLTERLGEE